MFLFNLRLKWLRFNTLAVKKYRGSKVLGSAEPGRTRVAYRYL